MKIGRTDAEPPRSPTYRQRTVFHQNLSQKFEEVNLGNNVNKQMSLETPEQQERKMRIKNINSPHMMVPNLIGKPFSWYNELEALDSVVQTNNFDKVHEEPRILE